MVHIELSKRGRMSSEFKTYRSLAAQRNNLDTDVTQGLIDASEADPEATLEDTASDPLLNVAPAIDISAKIAGRPLRSQL